MQFSIEYFLSASNHHYNNGNLELSQKIIEDGLGLFPGNIDLLEQLDTVTASPIRQIVVTQRLLNPRPRTKEQRPLVSITVGTYNQEKFIKECIESVISQTYTPLEIIIGDDASTDKTSIIINSILETYDGPHNIEFIQNEKNLGYSGGKNWHNLLRRTKGEFIIQFAGDDVMHSNMVEEMVIVWKKHDVSMVVVNSELIDAQSNLLEKNTRISTVSTPNDSLEALARDGVNDAVFGAGFGCDRRFYEAFPPCMGNPPKHLEAQDILFPFLSGFLSGYFVITVPLMKYRIHGNQNSLSINLSKKTNEIDKLLALKKIWKVHLSHACWMIDTLEQLYILDKSRFQPLVNTLTEHLKTQSQTMSRRLTEVHKKLFYQEK